MKQVFLNSIQNISGTDVFDEKFIFEAHQIEKGEKFSCQIAGIPFEVSWYKSWSVEVFFIEDILSIYKNKEILEKIAKFPAMWSEVYSPKNELEIFQALFDYATLNKKKIHILGITLWEEVDILEKYYESLGFFDTENNTFKVDFSLPLVTVSVKIQNIMWRGSDYKRLWEKIFLCPPIREAGQVKNLFKWINRWVIAWIDFSGISLDEVILFFQEQLVSEGILALTLAKTLRYNYEMVGVQLSKNYTIVLEYGKKEGNS